MFRFGPSRPALHRAGGVRGPPATTAAAAPPAPCNNAPQITDANGDGHHPATDVLAAWFSEAAGHLQAVIQVRAGTWVAEHDDAEVNGSGYALVFTRERRRRGTSAPPRRRPIARRPGPLRLRHLHARRRLRQRRRDDRRGRGRDGRHGDDRRPGGIGGRHGAGWPTRSSSPTTGSTAACRPGSTTRPAATARRHARRRRLPRRLLRRGGRAGPPDADRPGRDAITRRAAVRAQARSPAAGRSRSPARSLPARAGVAVTLDPRGAQDGHHAASRPPPTAASRLRVAVGETTRLRAVADGDRLGELTVTARSPRSGSRSATARTARPSSPARSTPKLPGRVLWLRTNADPALGPGHHRATAVHASPQAPHALAATRPSSSRPATAPSGRPPTQESSDEASRPPSPRRRAAALALALPAAARRTPASTPSTSTCRGDRRRHLHDAATRRLHPDDQRRSTRSSTTATRWLHRGQPRDRAGRPTPTNGARPGAA